MSERTHKEKIERVREAETRIADFLESLENQDGYERGYIWHALHMVIERNSRVPAYE